MNRTMAFYTHLMICIQVHFTHFFAGNIFLELCFVRTIDTLERKVLYRSEGSELMFMPEQIN